MRRVRLHPSSRQVRLILMAIDVDVDNKEICVLRGALRLTYELLLS